MPTAIAGGGGGGTCVADPRQPWLSPAGSDLEWVLHPPKESKEVEGEGKKDESEMK